MFYIFSIKFLKEVFSDHFEPTNIFFTYTQIVTTIMIINIFYDATIIKPVSPNVLNVKTLAP